MNSRALWIRRCCSLLIGLQAIGIGLCLFGVVKALLDDTPSDRGLTGKGLIPFFVIAILIISVLLLITRAVLREAESRFAWIAMLIMACITTLPFTSQLMNWTRR